LPAERAERRDGALTWEFDHAELVFALSVELHVGAVDAPVRFHMPLEISAA
jgi:hypothetical protein